MATTKFRNDMNITGDLTVDGTITGDVTGDVTGVFIPAVYTVATLPAAAAGNNGHVVFVSDGNAGEETLARSNGTNWIALASGATASAT